MLFRGFQLPDVDAVARVFHDAVHQLAAPHYDEAQRRAWAPGDLPEAKRRLEGQNTLVASSGEEIAGFVAFDDQGYIDLLFTNPKYARRGIASQLLSLAEDDLRARGVQRLTTHASLAARSVFEGRGFRWTETEDVAVRGVTLRRHALEKQLTSAPLVPSPGALQTMATSDGRVLSWRSWGPKVGRPVLFCTGAASSSALGFGCEAAEALNLRIIAVDRPGLGGSTHDPDRDLNRWVADVFGLLHREAATEPLVLGFSQGSVFALAVAAFGPVSALALVSGQEELAVPEALRGLPSPLRDGVERATQDPSGCEAEVRSWANAEAMFDLVMTTSCARDAAIYGAPEFAPHYRQALREALQAGPRGYARDTRLAWQRWPFDLGRIRCPVQIWYGEDDLSPMHALDHGQRLQERMPGANRWVVPRAGSSLLWTHAASILHSLSS